MSEPYKGDLSIFEDSNRERNLQLDRVMDILGVRPGARAADIGAGSGWFTVRAARRVGRGLVYAVKINSRRRSEPQALLSCRSSKHYRPTSATTSLT